jgi:hypothetical protein
VASEFHCPAGEDLYEEGQEAEYVAFILRGWFEYFESFLPDVQRGPIRGRPATSSKEGEESQEIQERGTYQSHERLERVRNGETMCESVLWMPWRHCGGLTAMLSSEVVRISAKGFVRIMEDVSDNGDDIAAIKRYACRYAARYGNVIEPTDMCPPRDEVLEILRFAFADEIEVAKKDPVLNKKLEKVFDGSKATERSSLVCNTWCAIHEGSKRRNSFSETASLESSPRTKL